MNDDMRPFRDREEAGRLLGERLHALHAWNDPVVLALPRGGVPVGAGVARALGAPLDILVVRKIGHPRHEEFAIGAIAAGGISVMQPGAEQYLGDVTREQIDRIVAREQLELERRERLYRGGAPAIPLRGRDAILVDDGLATGATMRAAALAVRQLAPARVIVAVPVGAQSSCAAMAQAADEVVCLRRPEPFQAVGLWYRDFPQTSDEEVQALLAATHPA